MLLQVIDGIDVRVGQLKAQDMGLVVAELVSLGYSDDLPWVKGAASSPAFGASSHTPVVRSGVISS